MNLQDNSRDLTLEHHIGEKVEGYEKFLKDKRLKVLFLTQYGFLLTLRTSIEI